MEDNIEEPAGMGVPSSAAVKADPDEVAESGIGGGGIVEVAVLAHLVLVSKTGRVACLAELSILSGYFRTVEVDGDLASGNLPLLL